MSTVTVRSAAPWTIWQSGSAPFSALDQALEELASFDVRQCRLVELKFFAGLSIEEMSEALGISTATVEREWVIARAWLYQRLAGSGT
jgi:RNA polymerase sigma factor (sigma-70 family)